MAKENTKGVQVTQPDAMEPAADVKYGKDLLIQQAAVLGTTPEIMAGALVSVKADTLTKREAADALKAYLGRPVERSK